MSVTVLETIAKLENPFIFVFLFVCLLFLHVCVCLSPQSSKFRLHIFQSYVLPNSSLLDQNKVFCFSTTFSAFVSIIVLTFPGGYRKKGLEKLNEKFLDFFSKITYTYGQCTLIHTWKTKNKKKRSWFFGGYMHCLEKKDRLKFTSNWHAVCFGICDKNVHWFSIRCTFLSQCGWCYRPLRCVCIARHNFNM